MDVSQCFDSFSKFIKSIPYITVSFLYTWYFLLIPDKLSEIRKSCESLHIQEEEEGET